MSLAIAKSTHIGFEEPVHAGELEAIADEQRISIEPGDALIVHFRKRRTRSSRAHLEPPWWTLTRGLSVTTLRFFKERDIAALVWDLMDAQPVEVGWPACAPRGATRAGRRPDRQLLPVAIVGGVLGDGTLRFLDHRRAPLKLVGGTGSPVNPIALL